jgi:hypothetical protein
MVGFDGFEPGNSWKKMLKCPVCHAHKLREEVGAKMLIDGRIMKVCSDCYWQAYKKTNLPRIWKSRTWSWSTH